MTQLAYFVTLYGNPLCSQVQRHCSNSCQQSYLNGPHLGPWVPSTGLPFAPCLAVMFLRLCKCRRLSRAGSATNLRHAKELQTMQATLLAGQFSCRYPIHPVHMHIDFKALWFPSADAEHLGPQNGSSQHEMLEEGSPMCSFIFAYRDQRSGGTYRTEAPSAPSAGSAAGSQICLGRLLPARYLKFGTFLPFPDSVISPLPPLPDLLGRSYYQRIGCRPTMKVGPCYQDSSRVFREAWCAARTAQ